MSSFLKWLFSPQIFIAVLLSLLWFYRHDTKRQKFLGITILSLLFIVWISPISYYITRPWERTYPAFNIEQNRAVVNSHSIHIIVLGAGFTNDKELSVTSKLDKAVSLRLLEALRIYNILDSAKIVTSGAALKRSISQAEAVANASVALGVAAKDTLYLSNTINTEDEAKSYLNRFGNKNQLILVTDALHMKRAVYWFNYYGLNVIPAPCNYLVKEDKDIQSFAWWPSYSKIKILDRLMDEWLGLQWAYFKTNVIY